MEESTPDVLSLRKVKEKKKPKLLIISLVCSQRVLVNSIADMFCNVGKSFNQIIKSFFCNTVGSHWVMLEVRPSWCCCIQVSIIYSNNEMSSQCDCQSKAAGCQ